MADTAGQDRTDGQGFGRDRAAADPDEAERLRQLAEDWITLWQSELAALAVDQEAHQAWRAGLDLWAGLAATLVRGMASRTSPEPVPPASRRGAADGDAAAPVPGARDAAGTAATGAASDPRDAEIERLRRQLLDVESRLAELERGGDSGRTGARRRRGGVSPDRPA